MHSSRMRTARSLTLSRSICGGGACMPHMPPPHPCQTGPAPCRKFIVGGIYIYICQMQNSSLRMFIVNLLNHVKLYRSYRSLYSILHIGIDFKWKNANYLFKRNLSVMRKYSFKRTESNRTNTSERRSASLKLFDSYFQ